MEESSAQVEVQKSVASKTKTANYLWISLGIIALVGTTYLGWRWWKDQNSYATTDNAQIQGHISPISSKVTGIVEKVLVSDGDHVKQGQLLIQLDSKDLKLQVEEAKANLAAAQAKLKMASATVGLTKDTNLAQVLQVQSNLAAKQASLSATQNQVDQSQSAVNIAVSKLEQSKAALEVAKANVNKAQTHLNKAQADWNRYQYLSSEGAVSAQQRDTSLATLKDAQAEFITAAQQVKQQKAEINTNLALVEQAHSQVKTTKSQYQQSLADIKSSESKVAETKVQGQQVEIQQSQSKSEQAQVSQFKAALALAQKQLDYTFIKSPVEGNVGKGLGQLTVQVGQLVQPQQPLLSVIPLNNDQLFIEANFKETDLKRITKGAAALVEADAYPGKTFQAVVAGISPATGAQFALIPPDNATGNFNKVVQWVPIRLNFKPGTDPNHLLRAGLSVRVKISSQNK
ncbi:MAG: HlyD family secretion protein [Cyanobacteriota bacterium ELA615]